MCHLTFSITGGLAGAVLCSLWKLLHHTYIAVVSHENIWPCFEAYTGGHLGLTAIDLGEGYKGLRIRPRRDELHMMRESDNMCRPLLEYALDCLPGINAALLRLQRFTRWPRDFKHTEAMQDIDCFPDTLRDELVLALETRKWRAARWIRAPSSREFLGGIGIRPWRLPKCRVCLRLDLMFDVESEFCGFCGSAM